MKKCTFIKCGKLFDGVTEKYLENQAILVEGDKIVAVGENLECPEDAVVIDLQDKTVTPGLADIHTHCTAFHNENIMNILSEVLTKPTVYRALGAVHHLNELLEHGFTLIRECGSVEKDWTLRDIRDSIREGAVSGPDFVVCGHSGGVSGGHMDLRQYVKNGTAQNEILRIPSIDDGAEFFRQWVRTEFLQGVDYIKFHIDGGFATPNDDPEQRHMTEDEIAAIIETAHECGLKATAHIYGDESARIALKHNVDGIEHGGLLEPETYDLIAEKGAYVIPTMCFFDRGVFLDEDALAHVPSYMAEKYRQKHEKLCRSRNALISHIENDTILVGSGTDLGCVEPMTPAYREYETMIRSGVSPFKALRIITSNSAKIVGHPELCHIAVGKKADIVAWKLDPIEKPEAFRECDFVMKSGKIIKSRA